MTEHRPPVVVAIGGNALIRQGERGTIDEQMAHASESMAHVAGMVKKGMPVVVTHGNGPAVGNLVLQMECARDSVPPMPLFIADADSEGWIGFMLQQSLYNHMRRMGIQQGVVSVVTQVVVDRDDPAFDKPSKPVGPFYNEAEAEALRDARGWVIFEDAGRGWRRVVPSPRPLRIIEADTVRRIAASGDVVIAAGGGGVPVIEDADGMLTGIDAVVDKDMASSVLATQIGARRMLILTSVESVFTGFGTPGQKPIGRMNIFEADRLMSEGQFAPGSMAPKVLAAVEFLEAGGEEVIITSPEKLEDALSGKSGTLVTR